MIELAIYVSLGVAVLSVIIGGISSVYTSLVCLRELSSFDRQVMRIDSLIGDLERHIQKIERGAQ